MPHALIDGVELFYEEVGDGVPLVFAHEWGGDYRSWRLQVRFFARRYRTITFCARGYPPSAVPKDVHSYSQELAVNDIRGLLDHLTIRQAHVCGLSMGAYATLLFGLTFPDRALSLTVCGGGYGSGTDRERFRQATLDMAHHLETEGMGPVAETYARGPTRAQLMRKDPQGWGEFKAWLASSSATGHANTLRGVQLTRPSVYDLEAQLTRCRLPALILVGDEDEPALEPSLFMKRKIPGAGLVVFPNSGHTINLEEPDLFNRALLDFLTAVEAGRWPHRAGSV